MASFDPSERQPVAEYASQSRSQVPRHFLENQLKRFIGCFPQLVEQIETHAKNLCEYHRRGDFTRMRAEMINATHTINRGQSSQQEFAQIRSEIPTDLIAEYEDRFSKGGVRLQEAIDRLHNVAKQLIESPATSTAGETSFSNATTGNSSSSNRHPTASAQGVDQCNRSLPSVSPSRQPMCITSTTGSLQFFYSEEDGMTSDETETSASRDSVSELGTLVTHASPPDTGASTALRAEDLNYLLQDVRELNGLIHAFSSSVQEQRQFVDSISMHVDDSAAAMDEATRHLSMAAKFKAAIIPVACGTVGAVIAGPVGLFAGFKLGAVAAAGAAGVGGVLIGRRLKEKKEQQIASEMSHLEHS